jgi:hypothetical protein
MTFSMLASDPLDAVHVAKVRVWLADRLVLDVELARGQDDHVVYTFDDAEWAAVLLETLMFDDARPEIRCLRGLFYPFLAVHTSSSWPDARVRAGSAY